MGPRLDETNRQFSLNASAHVLDTMDMNSGATISVTLGISVTDGPVPFLIAIGTSRSQSIGAKSIIDVRGSGVFGTFDKIEDRLQREGILEPGEYTLSIVVQVIGNGVVEAPATAAARASFTLSFGPRELYGILLGKFSGAIDGSGDMERVRNALLQFPGVKPENLSLATTSSEVTDRFLELREKIQPQDSFLFFYSGHGGVREDNSETPVPYEGEAARLLKRDTNTGDEYLAINHTSIAESGADTLTDDELRSLFGLLPRSVPKLAVLASCFSGGFWGHEGQEPADFGDLEKVPNTALLAAATEGTTAQAIPLGGTFFMASVVQALNTIAATKSTFSFSDLNRFTTAAYVAGSFPERGVICDSEPWLDTETPVEVDVGPLVVSANTTEDFDPQTPVSAITAPNRGLLSARLAGGLLQLSLPTIRDQRYTVEANPSLTSSGWRELTNFPGTGSLLEIGVPFEPGADQRYFRIRP